MHNVMAGVVSVQFVSSRGSSTSMLGLHKVGLCDNHESGLAKLGIISRSRVVAAVKLPP